VKIQRFVIILMGIALLSGCGGKDSAYVEKPPKVLYSTAMRLMKTRAYEKAADAFDELERQHPYSDYASKAQLLAGVCAFQGKNFARAIATLDVFIDLHPMSPSIAYAYYLRAMAHYKSMLGLKRDSEMAQLGLEAFKEVIRRFPKTDYAKDARIRARFVADHLTSRDMLLAKQYQAERRYVAAWIRFADLIKEWPETILMPEVLHRLVECQVALGMIGAADKTLAVLQCKFPKNSWTLLAGHLVARAKKFHKRHVKTKR
jgi:outer membrane protein assembly factor BamD